MPVLILHSKDDRLASYEAAVQASTRFLDCTFLSFEDGGHLMAGHEEQVYQAVVEFISKNNIQN